MNNLGTKDRPNARHLNMYCNFLPPTRRLGGVDGLGELGPEGKHPSGLTLPSRLVLEAAEGPLYLEVLCCQILVQALQVHSRPFGSYPFSPPENLNGKVLLDDLCLNNRPFVYQFCYVPLWRFEPCSLMSIFLMRYSCLIGDGGKFLSVTTHGLKNPLVLC